MTFINDCSDTIWIGVTGGFAGNMGCTPGTTSCSDQNPCPCGQACGAFGTDGTACYWTLPAPMPGGSFELAQGDEAVFTLAVNGGQMFAGRIYGQTGCTSTVGNCTQAQCGANCETAPCNTDSSREMPCATGTGPIGAISLAEFTLSNASVDFYDVSYVGGFNIPIEIRPTNGTLDSDPYHCGNPGATTASAGLNDCTYDFDTNITINGTTTDFAPYLRYVTNGGDTCTPTTNDPDPACTTPPEVCGLSLSEDFTPPIISTTCGTQIGWWNANAVCTTDKPTPTNPQGFNDGPFDCGGVIATGSQDTFFELYGCTGDNYVTSCYNCCQDNENCQFIDPTICCGCPMWAGIQLPTCSAGSCQDNCCFNTNNNWETLALPWAKFMKDACSTAYSFQYDDPTSGFTCPPSAPSPPSVNTTNYEVIFCPGGETGIPKQ